MTSTVIFKRQRTIESFNAHKLRASIVAACLSVRTPEGAAETTATEVVKRVERWAGSRQEVTSADIRRKATEALLAFNPEAAYIYRKH